MICPDCNCEYNEGGYCACPWEGPTCSICDGLGHGYPGGGPCPLEDRGYDDGPGFAWER